MKEFNEYNTDGYTKDQIDDLNDEWEKIVQDLGIKPGTDEYDNAAKNFADEVSRR